MRHLLVPASRNGSGRTRQRGKAGTGRHSRRAKLKKPPRSGRGTQGRDQRAKQKGEASVRKERPCAQFGKKVAGDSGLCSQKSGYLITKGPQKGGDLPEGAGVAAAPHAGRPSVIRTETEGARNEGCTEPFSRSKEKGIKNVSD